ncbi:TRAP transporter substrate-binding protein [Pusillimonas caeni]|uniref:TRAP transporter substrate-binding protein n=1 Tax=Pusillimonas caeni TaxID=1348472 RepID=UPI000E59C275|nr:TRAP transporter substrate-binding protein [Pusillimonas caeni]TFL15800.1 TRAP transporter substrate-binding protein [Pusillimonas caeni]
MSFRHFVGCALAATTILCCLPAAAETKPMELKLAHHVAPQHPMSVFLQTWADELRERSNGRIDVTIYPSQQMGPATGNHRMVTTGVADIVWLLHGLTPELFPLTGIAELPFMIDGAEAGARVMGDAELRHKYLDPEHKNMKVLWLFTSPAGNLNMAKEKVDSLEAVHGKRLRFPSRAIRDYITALQATPQATSPANMLEALQKGTIDGAFIDWGGAGLAFKLGPYVSYTTELHAYVSTMCICMNLDTYENMPDDLKALFDDSIENRQAGIGELWAASEAQGKAAMIEDGTKVVELSPQEMSRFKQAGAQSGAAYIESLAKRGLPAKDVYELMKSLSANTAQSAQ